jgi:lipopolysaccharide export system protein LptC
MIRRTLQAIKDAPIWKRIAALSSAGTTLAIALYIALNWGSSTPLSLLNAKPDKNSIDLFAEQVHGVKFDDNGKLVETLVAQRLDHYPERGESVLADPILDAQGKDGRVWKITSAVGTLIGDDQIRLENNVVAVDKTQTLRFESEKVDYFSDKQMATTDIAVTLHHVDDVTTAIGMRAYLKNNRIELLHNVDSHYASVAK